GGACVDTGPILLWDFEDVTTLAVVDLSGNDAHGTPTGGARAAGGKIGAAFDTDSGAGWVDVRTTLPVTDFTATAWFQTTAPDVGIVAAYAGGAPRSVGTTTDRELYLKGGRLAYRVSPGASSACEGKGPLANDGAWHHAALVCKASVGCRMFLDGQELCRSKYFDDRSHLAGALGWVAGWTEKGGSGAVLIDHVALFAFPMDDADVTALMATGVQTAASGSNLERCNGLDMDCSGTANDACENGDLCSTVDVCQSGQCVGAVEIACKSPSGQCEQNQCDARTGSCVTRLRAAGGACDDGASCTSGDACDGNGRCAGSGVCLSGSAWFPTSVVDAKGKSMGTDIIIYDLRGAPKLGCLVPLANELGAFGKWKLVQGTTDSYYHQGPVGFGEVETLGTLSYRCKDVKWVLSTDLTVGLNPFTIGGKITVPFPDVGFSAEMALAPPPVQVNAPYLALGIQSGASLSYLQAPLQPDRDYFFLSGLFGANLTFPGALPIPFPGTKSVDIVFDPFDPMFHIGLGGLLEFPVGPATVGIEALAFSNGGNLRHKAFHPLWFGEFDSEGDLKFKTVTNDAHAYAQVSVAFSPFKPVAEYSNGVGEVRFTFTGQVSVGLDAAKDGFDGEGGSSTIFDAIMKGTPSANGKQADVRTLANGNLAFKIPLKRKMKKQNPNEIDRFETIKAPAALGGKDVALGFALAQSVLLVDSTPGKQVVALRARTNKMPWESVPVLKDLLQSFNFKLDVNGYWQEVNGASSGGVAIEVVTPTPFRIPGLARGIPFNGQLYVDSVSGFRLRGSLDLGKFELMGASFEIGEVGPVEASWDGEKFCLGAAVTVPKSFEKEGGGTETTTCSIVPCFGKNGFDGSRLKCAPFCFADSECEDDKACIWGTCQAKLNNGGACSSNGACASGHCFSGFCVECWPGQSECGGGKFCDNAGYCQNKLDFGAACVGLTAGQAFMRNDWCESGKCDTTCVDCWAAGPLHAPVGPLDYTDTCGSGKFCSALGKCTASLPGGEPCFNVKQATGIDYWCKNDDCDDVTAICRDCGPGAKAQCSSTEYCLGYGCQAKVADGTLCLANDVCLSGSCTLGVSTTGGPASYCYTANSKSYDDACKVNPECKSGACRATDGKCSCNFDHDQCVDGWCDGLGFCQPEWALGHACGGDVECASGHCAGICVECTAQAHCPAETWCAADGDCKDQASDGTTCLTDIECRSGACGPGIEKFCFAAASKDYGASCHVQAECKSGQCLAGDVCGCAGDHENCSDDQYCDPAGYCQTKLPDTTPCTENAQCESGKCPSGFCVRCLNDGECAAGQFCDLTGFCQSKLALGTTCERDVVCVSGKCAGVCIECLVHGDCGASAWCAADGRCKAKAADGTTCLGDVECASGTCGTGIEKFCFAAASKGYGATCHVQAECVSGQCLAGDVCGCAGSHSNCSSTQYCDPAGYCQTKLADTTPCTENAQCESGKCPSGYCVRCLNDGECAAGQFCDLAGFCKSKLALGATCERDAVCLSGKCAGVCIECLGHGDCAANAWCAADGRCKAKAGDGTACLDNVECASGACGAGVEKFCYTAGSKPYGGACKVQAECVTTQCLAFGTCGCAASNANCAGTQFCDNAGYCQTKLGNGGVCTANSQCQSGKCPAGYCVQCLSDGECVGGQFCDAAGYCQNKLATGTACIKDSACASGMCSGVCVDCRVDGHCSGGQYCDGVRCANKLANGGVCSANSHCQSGKCPAGYCVQCLSDGECAGGQFCDGAGYCQNKLATGSACIKDSACATGLCSGVCVNCKTNSHCGGGQFCDGVYCQNKKGLGSTCLTNSECSSGQCAAGFCGCNYADENCSGGYYCDAAACFGKKAGGSLCSRGGECQSGSCSGGVCGCAGDSQCGSTQYCSGGTCTAKLAAGAGCSSGNQCISGTCQGVNCNGYECGCTTCYGPCWYAPWQQCGYSCGCTTCYSTCYQCTLF
ncbi:MAG: hypothetical protein IV100_15160, partial [Myxococcales bacterium]|nr:hypothetical protein [Myxococcales bacterium]